MSCVPALHAKPRQRAAEAQGNMDICTIACITSRFTSPIHHATASRHGERFQLVRCQRLLSFPVVGFTVYEARHCALATESLKDDA